MKNGWIETPTSPHELPWVIRAGKRVLWWISLEPHGPYPARSFQIIGSLIQKHPQQTPYIQDKEDPGGGYFYLTATAYKELGKGPNDE
jgi:hypothetical protein